MDAMFSRPLAAFPIVVGYNVPAIAKYSPLLLTMDIVAQIWMGNITNWNHSEIAMCANSALTSDIPLTHPNTLLLWFRLNVGYPLPDAPIQVVVDVSSSYTYPFTYALSQANSAFAESIGISSNYAFNPPYPILVLDTGTISAPAC